VVLVELIISTISTLATGIALLAFSALWAFGLKFWQRCTPRPFCADKIKSIHNPIVISYETLVNNLAETI
jgi:hypothetical protein